jgi:hypothetical protein
MNYKTKTGHGEHNSPGTAYDYTLAITLDLEKHLLQIVYFPQILEVFWLRHSIDVPGKHTAVPN